MNKVKHTKNLLICVHIYTVTRYDNDEMFHAEEKKKSLNNGFYLLFNRVKMYVSQVLQAKKKKIGADETRVHG